MNFLDTNILLRHLLQDHKEHSPKATEYLLKVQNKEIQATTSDTVIFEAVFTLQRLYKRSKESIKEALLPLLDLPSIRLSGKQKYRRVFDLYVDLNISFADAYHIVFMEKKKLTRVASFDKDFDRAKKVSKIKRIKL